MKLNRHLLTGALLLVTAFSLAPSSARADVDEVYLDSQSRISVPEEATNSTYGFDTGNLTVSPWVSDGAVGMYADFSFYSREQDWVGYASWEVYDLTTNELLDSDGNIPFNGGDSQYGSFFMYWSAMCYGTNPFKLVVHAMMQSGLGVQDGYDFSVIWDLTPST